ncbi:uncharacterized protein LOC144869162 [Branchiostoma floridae x Branchiostoma japonicum]
MDDSPRPTFGSSTAREEERLEKVLREGTFRDSLVMAKVIDTHPSSDSDSDEVANRPQCEPKDNGEELQQKSADKAGFLETGEDKLRKSGVDKSQGDATAGDRCSEDTIEQNKQKSNRDPTASESEASAPGEATSQDTKAEKAGGSKQESSTSTPSTGDSESSVGSSSESGSDSDHNRSNDGANAASTDDRNQVFITIETPLFVRSHYVYLPKKKKTEGDDDKEEDKDDSGTGPSTSNPDDPTSENKEHAGPSKRKHSSDSASESEGNTPGTNKRQKRESEELQGDSSKASENVVKDSKHGEEKGNVDEEKGKSETKTGQGSSESNVEKQKEMESPKAASLKRPLEEDDSRQESPKRRRQSSGPDATPIALDDATCKRSETQVSDRTENPLSEEGTKEARPTPQEGADAGDHQVSPTPRRRRSFTERYYEDAPILPTPPAPIPPAEAPVTAAGASADASTTEGAATTSEAASPTTTDGTSDDKKAPSPLGPPWNMYDPRNPESSSIRGTKKERYNLRIAQAMVDNAINTVLQELGFSPGSSRRKRRRRRERERQQAMEEAGVSSAIRSQGLSMGHRGGRTTTTSPGCPHQRRTSELNAGAGPSSASLPVPENEDEFERLAVSEAISQAGLSKSEEPKDGSKDKDSSA